MSRIFRPDTSWVRELVQRVDLHDSLGDVFVMADLLSDSFFDKRVVFDVADRAFYGSGVFRDKLSAKACLVGALWHGWESEGIMSIFLSKKFTPEVAQLPEFVWRLEELISHELIHGEQSNLSSLGHVGGYLPEDKYYSDPHEIAAIASEMEIQLLRIEPDVSTLIGMIKRGDQKLHLSDRYRLYAHSLREEPVKFRRSYNKMMRALVERLTQGECYAPRDFTSRRGVHQAV